MTVKQKLIYAKVLFAMWVIVSFYSCSRAEDYERIQNNSTFNEYETKQIIRLQMHFENELFGLNSVSIEKCYNEFFKKLKEQISLKNVNINLIENSYGKILDNLDQELKDDFFIERNLILNRRIPNSDRTKVFPDSLKTISINVNGKFFDYIESELVELDINIKRYFDTYNKHGDVSLIWFTNMIMDYEKLNFQDERVRFFLIINYLTFIDDYVKVKRSHLELNNGISSELKRRN